jgi:hypothetical protein
MLSDSFDLPESLVTAARKVLEATEHDKKQVAVPPRHEDDSKVLLEKGKKKELDEKKEVIIFDPQVDPNQLAQSDKAPK